VQKKFKKSSIVLTNSQENPIASNHQEKSRRLPRKSVEIITFSKYSVIGARQMMHILPKHYEKTNNKHFNNTNNTNKRKITSHSRKLFRPEIFNRHILTLN
jgi:hypothetical protein